MTSFVNHFLIVLVSVVAISLSTGIFITKDECPPNEEYLLCGSACPFNCSDPEGPATCSDDCVEGCFCKSGMLRNQNGTCVNADECFEDTNSTLCAANEEFLVCGGTCIPTCAQPVPPSCDSPCTVGCFCKAGYVRDTKNNKCVTVNQCPAEQCFNDDEVFDICNAACEPSCADPVPICEQVCTSGCVCAPGLLRNETGSCVPAKECSQSNATEPGLLGKYINVINKILHLTANTA